MYKVKVQMVLDEKPKYELVTDDVYNIAERIRRIDPNYFIVFNRRTHRYEVHNTENIGNTFCFLVPFGKLDKRTLEYCRETRVERNVAELVEERNERVTKSFKRAREWEQNDRARELADVTKRIVEGETLSYGYKSSHYVKGAF